MRLGYLERPRGALALGLVLVLACAAASRAALAEQNGALAAVEEAYRAVDFEGVLRLAQAAIEAGGHGVQDMARLELLLGVANAALDHPQAAQTAFIRLLGIDPTQKLERELSPRLRAPYLEARGFWSANRERLSASARVEAGALSVSLSDPAQMVREIRVSFRQAGQTEFRDSRQAASATTRVPLTPKPGPGELEVAIALLDEHGNTLGEKGTELAPLRLQPEMSRAARPEAAASAFEATTKPSYLLPTTLSVLGLASTAAAVAFHVQRERSAREWNGRACERPGSTRGEQCADVERRIRQDEWLSVGLYAGGAALLTLGAVSFVATEAAQRERASAQVSCDAALTSTLGVWCSGRF
jgi:hypothetical protein